VLDSPVGPRCRQEAAVPDVRFPPGFDFTDPDLYARRVPLPELAELRRSAPVWWNAQRRGSAGFDDEGFWVG
jgi:cholest-4-en-3-one 26-monooxygenase